MKRRLMVAALAVFLLLGASSAWAEDHQYLPAPEWAAPFWAQANTIMLPHLKQGQRMADQSGEYVSRLTVDNVYFFNRYGYGKSNVPEAMRGPIEAFADTLSTEHTVYLFGCHDGGNWDGSTNHEVEHNNLLDITRAKQTAEAIRLANPAARVIVLSDGIAIPRKRGEDVEEKRGAVAFVVREVREEVAPVADFSAQIDDLDERVCALENKPEPEAHACSGGRDFSIGPLVGWSWVNANDRWYDAAQLGFFLQTGRVRLWGASGMAPSDLESETDQISEVGLAVRIKDGPFELWASGIDARVNAGQDYGWGDYYLYRSRLLAGGIGLDTGRFWSVFSADVRAGLGAAESEVRIPSPAKERDLGATISVHLRAHF